MYICKDCGSIFSTPAWIKRKSVCPDCGSRCKACLGTNTVMSRESLRNLKNDPFAISQIFTETKEPAERFNPDEYGRE